MIGSTACTRRSKGELHAIAHCYPHVAARTSIISSSNPWLASMSLSASMSARDTTRRIMPLPSPESPSGASRSLCFDSSPAPCTGSPAYTTKHVSAPGSRAAVEKHPPFAAKHTHSACSNSGHGACEVKVGRTHAGCTTAAPAVPNSPLQTEVRKHTVHRLMCSIPDHHCSSCCATK